MNEQQVAIANDQRPRAQPRQQFIAIGRVEDRAQRVASMRLAMPGRDGEQMEVVVAEYGDAAAPSPMTVRITPERIGTAVDQVADEPQSVVRSR